MTGDLPITPFRIAVPDEEIADLHRRLDAVRTAPEPGGPTGDWRYGVESGYLADFLADWRAYDWRRTEAEINGYPQFRTEIDGVTVHFLHRRAGNAHGALILTHGWPWTFWDFKEVVSELTDPRPGPDGTVPPAFDVVVPSLPGFGFSSPLAVDGLGTQDVARMWHRLMRALGYGRYGAVGSDFGVPITTTLGAENPDHVTGVYVTSAPDLGAGGTPAPDLVGRLLARLNGPTSVLAPGDFAPAERHRWQRMRERWITTLGHVAVQSTFPQTLATALLDSPAGLAAWLLERRWNWAGRRPDAETPADRRVLLDLVSIYWYTRTVGSSARLYWHSLRSGYRAGRVTVPLGVAVYPDDLVFRPRARLAAQANLVHWTEQPRGGHFAAAEVPDLYAADVRAFFSELSGVA